MIDPTTGEIIENPEKKEGIKLEVENKFNFEKITTELLKSLSEAEEEMPVLEPLGSFDSILGGKKYVKVDQVLSESLKVLRDNNIKVIFNVNKFLSKKESDKTSLFINLETHFFSLGKDGGVLTVFTPGIKTDRKEISLYSAITMAKKYAIKSAVNVETNDEDQEDYDFNKKEEHKKVDIKKAETIKPAKKKIDLEEPKKAEPKKAEPKKEEPKKAEPKKAEPKKAEPEKAEPKKEEEKDWAKKDQDKISNELINYTQDVFKDTFVNESSSLGLSENLEKKLKIIEKQIKNGNKSLEEWTSKIEKSQDSEVKEKKEVIIKYLNNLK